jgi:hypothetical protein
MQILDHDVKPSGSNHPVRRAAVVVPPLQDFYFTRHRFSSLGAHIVADVLKKSGMDVNFLNFPLMNTGGTITDLPKDLAYLGPFLIEEETGKLSFFTRFRHFGPSIDKCVNEIFDTQPDVCFFSVFAFCYADTAIALAQALKKRTPSTIIVAGGAGPSAYPGFFLGKKAFDFVLSGEAESSLLLFVNYLNSARTIVNLQQVPNLFWNTDGSVRSSGMSVTPGDSDVSFAFVKTANSSRRVTYSTMLSRGCPGACTFCSSRLMFGPTFRSVPVGKIHEALTAFSSKQNNDGKEIVINIEDDNFLFDTGYFNKAITIFKDHFPGVRFIAENGIDYSLLTPDICNWLLSIGMTKFNLALVSINREALSASNRFINQERYENVIAMLNKNKIPTVTYFICGFKEDTVKSTAQNLAYLANQHTLTGISLFYAVPGLPGFTNTAIFDGISSSLCCGSSAFPWNNSLSTETMITAFRLSRFGNLVKSGLFSETEKKLVEIITDRRELYTTINDKHDKGKIIPVENQDRELVRSYFALL